MQPDTMISQSPESEAAIRRTLARMQEGFQKKNGEVFASAFAKTHDYVVINGMLLADTTREANAQVHQELFEGSRQSAFGADLSAMEPPEAEVRNLRFLTPDIAVAHIVSRMGGQDAAIVSAVLQQQQGEWLIVAFHNAPVLIGKNPFQAPS